MKKINLKRNRFFIKYFLFLCIVLIVPLTALLLASSHNYKLLLKNEYEKSNIIILNQIIKTNEQMADNIIGRINEFVYSNEVLQWLNETEMDVHKISMRFYNILSASKFIDSIYVYSTKSDVVLTNKLKTYPLQDFFDKSWIDSLPDTETEPYKYRLREYSYLQYSFDIATIIKGIMNESGSNGYVIINLDVSKLLRAYQLSNMNIHVSIFNEHNELLVTDDRILETWSAEQLRRIQSESKMTNDISVLDHTGNTLILYAQDSSNWSYIYSAKLTGEQNFKNIQTYFILYDVFAVLLALVFALFMTQRIIKPFNLISKMLKEAEIGKRLPVVSVANYATDNIDYLVKRISETLIDRENYKEELEKKIELLKISQMIALNNQIKPHFLHNTLITIRLITMDLTGGDNTASKAITALSGLLRMSIDNRQFVKFENEVNYVKLYVELQQIRFENMFCLQLDIDEKTHSQKVIQFLLQPFVENSILHGIIPKGRNGTIRIRSWIDNQKFIVEISDDGIGMSEESLIKLRELQPGEYGAQQHVGIRNVINRLSILYNNGFKILFSSDGASGTTITIILPYEC